MRTWHAGLPLTNGESRENVICTFSAPPPVTPLGVDPGRNFPHDQWPTFTYGGAPTVSGYSRDFRQCGRELEARGLLDTPVRRQLMACELGHPEACALAAANGWRTRPINSEM